MLTKIKTLLIILIFNGSAHATTISSKDLNELVYESDHIIHVVITKVDMLDGEGNQIRDLNRRTGPGSKNLIRLHATVLKGGVIKTSREEFPSEIVVSLWQKWHYTLGQISEGSLNQEVIFLLRGKDLVPVYPAYFQRAISEREEIIRLIK